MTLFNIKMIRLFNQLLSSVTWLLFVNIIKFVHDINVFDFIVSYLYVSQFQSQEQFWTS
jgi:hypothetical protein